MDLRVKRGASVLLINLALLLVGTAGVELVLGDWIHPSAINRLNIVRSRSIRFDVEGLYEWPSRTVVYTRDKHGLRGTFADPSEIDVLTVGGSTTDQRFLNDGYTWQDVIQQRFHEVGKSVVVGNAGVDGQSTVGHIKNFDWWFPNIPRLKPKCVLFYVGINDFHVKPGSGFDALVIDEQDKSLRQILKERSVVYHALRTIHGAYLARYDYELSHLARDFSTIEWTKTPLQSSYDDIMKTRLKEFDERLRILIRKTREFGSNPVFATQPSRWYRLKDGVIEGTKKEKLYDGVTVNGLDYYYMMGLLDRVMISVCRTENVPCFDMAKEVSWEDDDFYDFAHMTPTGARKAGEYLFARLESACPDLSRTE